MAEILDNQVSKLKDTSKQRLFDKTECLLLKTCIDLMGQKLDEELEDIIITNRTILSDIEKQELLRTATLN